MCEKIGMVFDVQRFSVHDGPGIRTTFFLKGCPLKCKWCHNPEGLVNKSQLYFENEKCIMCGDCAKVCKNHSHNFTETDHEVDFSRCKLCEDCVHACPAKALSKMGDSKTPKEIIELALKDKAFYGQDGGITFSGGESTMQIDFLEECLKSAKEIGLNTAVDTCGFTTKENLLRIIPYTDLFLYDIKAFTDEIHIEATGVSNKIILENYHFLKENNAKVWVRIPVVNGYNAMVEEMTKIADFLKEHDLATQIELMPYHVLGSNKYEQLGLAKNCTKEQIVEKKAMDEIIRIFKERNLPIK